MSYFITHIPVDVEAVKKLLPEGSSVVHVEFDPNQKRVSLRWYNNRYVTKYTFPVDFTLEMLQNGEKPEEATIREVQKPVVPPTPPLDEPPVVAPKRTRKGKAQ